MPRFAAPSIERVSRPGGGFILRSTAAAPQVARCLGAALVHGAAGAPDRTLYAERAGDGDGWRRITYREAALANQTAVASSQRVTRAVILTKPASIDAT